MTAMLIAEPQLRTANETTDAIENTSARCSTAIACPRAADGCTLTGKDMCPDDQALIDTCPTC